MALSTLQARLAGAGLVLAAGVGIGIAYEHYAPWALGPRHQRLVDSLPERDSERYTAGAEAQKIIDQVVVTERWAPALAQCEARQTQGSETAADSIQAERDAARRSSDAAFRLGQASCTGAKTNESRTTASSGTVPQRLPGDEDLRSLVAGSIGTAP